MDDALLVLLLAGAGLASAVLAAVTGFGGAAVLLPVLVMAFGVRDAVPTLTVAQLIGNASRVWLNRSQVSWAVVRWFALGGVPAGVVGGVLFATAPLTALKRLLGAFLLLVVVFRHTDLGTGRRMRLRWFAPLGAASSLVSALVGSVGPLMAPFFLAFGLTKGAYIGTEALATVIMHCTKLVAYGGTSVLGRKSVGVGLLLGPVLIAGSYIGKWIVDRVSERAFTLVIEVTLVLAGLLMVASG
jgi:uncharacterized membrane protein YfcA